MMNTAEIREAINKMIAKSTDADRVAGLELAREYFTNPEFRKALEQATWEANNG